MTVKIFGFEISLISLISLINLILSGNQTKKESLTS